MRSRDWFDFGLQHQKFRQYFTQKISKISAQKDRILQKFRNIKKKAYSKFWQKWKY